MLRAATVGALIALAACVSPTSLEEATTGGQHTTSSGNHTTSSGNLVAR